MTPTFSTLIAIPYAALTAMFVGMFVLLAGLLVREFLPGHVVRRGYTSEWFCSCGLVDPDRVRYRHSSEHTRWQALDQRHQLPYGDTYQLFDR
jgi:hypothetical protein